MGLWRRDRLGRSLVERPDEGATIEAVSGCTLVWTRAYEAEPNMTATYRYQVVKEIDQIPLEYLPSVLQMIRALGRA